VGWKWNDIALDVDRLVAAKKVELEDKLLALAMEAQGMARTETDIVRASFQRGRASAFAEVREAVKP
jgi:hypothetical protein